MTGSWQIPALGSFSTGVAFAPWLQDPGEIAGSDPVALGVVVLIGALVLAVSRTHSDAAGAARILCMTATALAAGVLAGTLRTEAIDAGASYSQPGDAETVRGEIARNPSRSKGTTRMPIDTADGLLMVETPDPVAKAMIGKRLSAEGRVVVPSGPYAAYLRREGMARVLRADSVQVDDHAGPPSLRGILAKLRDRSTEAIAAGLPDRHAALARSLILGQEHLLDPSLRDSFRRSGLSHLLAVSGQNVVLLILIASVPLGYLSLPIRRRVFILIALVLVYIPLAGGDPSIQRAGTMGIAGLLALAGGRPALRWFGIFTALAITLLINPRATGDPGWQLSFVAVLGIQVLSGPLRSRLADLLGAGRIRDAAVDGAAVTVAATLATLPLITGHFGELSVVSIATNVLALPAVAPAMWLGMSSMSLGAFPGIPAELVNQLNLVPLSYLMWMAELMSAPDWASFEVPGWVGPAIVTTALVSVSAALRSGIRARAVAATGLVVLVLIPTLGSVHAATVGVRSAPNGGRLTALDIGQGDAILLEDAGGGAVLFDTGPPGSGIGRKLARAGIKSLDAVVITHDDRDHSGGLEEVLSRLPVSQVLRGTPLGEATRAHAVIADVPIRAVSQGDALTLGNTRISILWPQSSAAPSGPDDSNADSIVAHLTRGSFDALLTGDAEYSEVPIATDPVDLLKVAHHGSEDQGLDDLLSVITPERAWISVGSDNRHGHPHRSTISALENAGTNIQRTDQDGTLTIELR